jgi:uncharacterized protein DUF4404
MSGTAITELLKRLHHTLEDSTSISDGDRKLLMQLSLDIRDLLARPGATADAKHRSILVRIQDAVTRFEVTHPDITGVLAAVSKVLADMGI